MIRDEERNGVRLLRMELGSGNALGPRVVEAISAALDAEQRPTVLTGEGGIFSTGLNLVELAAFSRDELNAMLDLAEGAGATLFDHQREALGIRN